VSVLVTGGAGFIGSHMVLALRDRQESVVVLDDLSTGTSALIPDGTPFVRADIADVAVVERTIREHAIDTIVHFAAKIVVSESVENPLLYYDFNTARARTLIEVAARAKLRAFVFSSTAAVYGEAKSALITEDERPAPVSAYGRSKLMTEWMLTEAGRAHGLPHAILRYFNVAGADPDGRSGQVSRSATHLIKRAMQAATGEIPELHIHGTDYPTPDGTGVRDFIHVTDLCAAHLAAIDHLRAGRGNVLVNCGYGRGSSVREVIDAVKRVSGVDFAVREGPRRAGDPASLVADNQRLRETLGWAPRCDRLDTIVEHAFAWERRMQRRY
jgi:UDP-glucose 4-epimerase